MLEESKAWVFFYKQWNIEFIGSVLSSGEFMCEGTAGARGAQFVACTSFYPSLKETMFLMSLECYVASNLATWFELLSDSLVFQ